MLFSEMYEKTVTVQSHKRLHETDTISVQDRVLQIIENNHPFFLVMAEFGSSNNFIEQ